MTRLIDDEDIRIKNEREMLIMKDIRNRKKLSGQDEDEDMDMDEPKNQSDIENNSNKLLDETLKKRGGIYGSFERNAEVSMELQAILGFEALPDYQKAALQMICHKLARISTGKPHADNWVDIAGYAMLAVKCMQKDDPKGAKD